MMYQVIYIGATFDMCDRAIRRGKNQGIRWNSKVNCVSEVAYMQGDVLSIRCSGFCGKGILYLFLVLIRTRSVFAVWFVKSQKKKVDEPFWCILKIKR
jgi:hypothetical protein